MKKQIWGKTPTKREHEKKQIWGQSWTKQKHQKTNIRKILNQKDNMRKKYEKKNWKSKREYEKIKYEENLEPKKKTAKSCIKQKILNAENFYQQIRQGP